MLGSCQLSLVSIGNGIAFFFDIVSDASFRKVVSKSFQIRMRWEADPNHGRRRQYMKPSLLHLYS